MLVLFDDVIETIYLLIYEFVLYQNAYLTYYHPCILYGCNESSILTIRLSFSIIFLLLRTTILVYDSQIICFLVFAVILLTEFLYKKCYRKLIYTLLLLIRKAK